jgi:type IX secretion system PorP/SprF family membrane protein
MKVSVHGGVRIPLYNGTFKRDRIPVLSPSFVYKRQGSFEQLDVGAYLLYDPIILGLWYRGIPVSKNADNSPSQDAVVVILGFQFDRFEVVYSYDFTVSKLGAASGGAHEVAMKYRLEIKEHAKRKKKDKYIPCPSIIRKEL